MVGKYDSKDRKLFALLFTLFLVIVIILSIVL